MVYFGLNRGCIFGPYTFNWLGLCCRRSVMDFSDEVGGDMEAALDMLDQLRDYISESNLTIYIEVNKMVVSGGLCEVLATNYSSHSIFVSEGNEKV